MPDLVQTLAPYQIVRDIIAQEKPTVIRALADAEGAGDMTIAFPHFWGQNDMGRRVPGTWLVSLEDRLKGSKAGIFYEGLWECWSTRFPTVKNTVPWITTIEKSHRIASHDEVIAHLKVQDQKRAEMEEANLRLKKVRAVTVRPADAKEFGAGESLEQLREKLKLLREIKSLEAK